MKYLGGGGGGGSGASTAHGTYTGDGNATQGITGVGFQPIFVIIRDDQGDGHFSFKTASDSTKSGNWWHGGSKFVNNKDDMIVSLDADGFTVGDGTGFTNTMNVNTRVYTFFAVSA